MQSATESSSRAVTRGQWSLWLVSFVAGCAAVAALTVTGCSSASGPATATGGSGAATEPAKQAVVTFLEAIKRGDNDAASAQLSKVAKARTEELGMMVAPPVKPSATYSVSESEMVGDAGDLVHVATTWTDTDEEGFKSSEEVVWVVRLDPEGWRVVGMAMKVFPDMPPLLLNFEDPEDMVAKQEMVAEELQRRATASAQGEGDRTARVPATTVPVK
ncbi:MAG: hypothetical protein KGQ61_04595 [Planctomycetes bacterium]|nr:hypothetical protein [Planctomycetota bacterium]